MREVALIELHLRRMSCSLFLGLVLVDFINIRQGYFMDIGTIILKPRDPF